ncbi:hypothetical protein A6302_02495 [Methylobrevis pamukkalensis]|uniref:Uncharacterized protein n=1 Tax=Methylobrevis pamukkalensis TaxID=1439726 RepID=A0A1E3H3W5_9HYPH|nr:hypothetical protein A6302_02495 [Methylobrevis pamukkalensis]
MTGSGGGSSFALALRSSRSLYRMFSRRNCSASTSALLSSALIPRRGPARRSYFLRSSSSSASVLVARSSPERPSIIPSTTPATSTSERLRPLPMMSTRRSNLLLSSSPFSIRSLSITIPRLCASRIMSRTPSDPRAISETNCSPPVPPNNSSKIRICAALSSSSTRSMISTSRSDGSFSRPASSLAVKPSRRKLSAPEPPPVWMNSSARSESSLMPSVSAPTSTFDCRAT